MASEDYRDFVDSTGKNGAWVNENFDPAIPWPFEDEDYVDVVTGNEIIKALKNRPQDKPFCLFGSFCGPHRPYDAPKRWMDIEEDDDSYEFIPGPWEEMTDQQIERLKKQRKSARAMLRLIDHQIGRVFKELDNQGILNDTLITFTSDHGDMLGDHQRIQKGIYWKESVSIPLLIRHPRYLNGTVVESPVELTDLTATILESANLNHEKELSKEWPAFNNIIPGKSLIPLIMNETGSIREAAFSECNNEWELLQTKDWKYIKRLGRFEPDQPRSSLFNRINDPGELNDLSNDKSYQELISWFESKRVQLKDDTPACQTSWAPLL
ncbi:MAG: sulfatase-like hydrolase/transferase [Spirochaetales bacterium]|nr:sulfatase-like hydrolase/transferase [Spirochaetales bacterium]